ncbi:hypothetical protein C0Q70_18019 [Pomacea canaliculata]|uniref:Amidohydrolase-related domain-containing protein n=1 Tax=Pomacea canaliculata TaxID=400727 RepID=A0A2T7NM18_POMCA|nr:hypothetical protein C0Q70_18019 [Pomacea canaliculata]
MLKLFHHSPATVLITYPTTRLSESLDRGQPVDIWDLSKFSYPWPTENEAEIFRNFGPEDLRAAMQGSHVRHCVFVQCLNDCIRGSIVHESRAPLMRKREAVSTWLCNTGRSRVWGVWMCQEADKHSFIKGIVAGIDITSDKLNATLNILTGHPRIVGIRHILDLEPDKEWLAREATIKGLIQCTSSLSFLGNSHGLEWLTEADLKAWKEKDFEPYVKHVLNCFGPERCMFGSDWPVCGLAGATYSDVFNMMLRLVSKLSPGNEAAIFRDNAVRFYGLKI